MSRWWTLILVAVVGLASSVTIARVPVVGNLDPIQVSRAQGEDAVGCATTAQIPSAWPPQGTLRFGFGREQLPLDTSAWRFEDAEVVAVACGNLRGLGLDTVVVYRVPWRLIPTPGLTGNAFPTSPLVLSVLPSDSSQLLNLDLLQVLGDGVPSIELQDVTGDGVSEIILWGPAPQGAPGAAFRIWRWQEGSFESVFAGDSARAPRFVRQDGPGTPVMVLEAHMFLGSNAETIPWPTGYRWNGLTLAPVLVPSIYGEITRDLEEQLQNPQGPLPPETASTYGTYLGNAYTIQGRSAEARDAYGRAWAAYPRTIDPYRCDDPSPAVRDFYSYVPWQLPRAYGMADRALGDSFPEFAAGFARTRQVRTVEGDSSSQVLAQEGDTYLVGVRVQAVDLTEDGEAETQFSGIWRVRRDHATRVCTLEEATILPGDSSLPVPAMPVSIPPRNGVWADVLDAEPCAPSRFSPGLDHGIANCLPHGFVGFVAAGPELHDNAIWWGIAGQGWTVDDSLRRHQGADPTAMSLPELSAAGQIAYLSQDSNIWLVNADGTERRRLTNDVPPISLSDLAWSPRGDALAFTRRDLTTQSSSVRIIGSEGQAQQDIPEASTPAWSPDGRKIAYLHIRSTREPGLFEPDLPRPAIMDLASGEVVVIDPPAVRNLGEGPRWSPDNASIVYLAGRGDIQIVSADGSSIRTLELQTLEPCRRFTCAQISRPTWSPNGRDLAWLVGQPGGSPVSPPGSPAGPSLVGPPPGGAPAIGPPPVGPPLVGPPFTGPPPTGLPPGSPPFVGPPPVGPTPPLGPPGGPDDERLGRLWLVAEDINTGEGYIQIDVGHPGSETMCATGDLSWLASGREIVANARCLPPGQSGVVRVDVATGATHTTPAWDVTTISLSPDERYIAFSTVLPWPSDPARGLQGGYRTFQHIWVGSIDGSDVMLLGEGHDPVWRPATP